MGEELRPNPSAPRREERWAHRAKYRERVPDGDGDSRCCLKRPRVARAISDVGPRDRDREGDVEYEQELDMDDAVDHALVAGWPPNWGERREWREREEPLKSLSCIHQVFEWSTLRASEAWESREKVAGK